MDVSDVTVHDDSLRLEQSSDRVDCAPPQVFDGDAGGAPAEPAGDPGQAGETADPQVALERWRAELAGLGGHDSLLFYRETSDGTLDLGHAHPNGVAGFLAGRPTRLSYLFREEGALAAARGRARAVAIAGSRLTDEHGLPGNHLALGLLSWPDPPSGPPGVLAPILLRPIRLQPKGVGAADYELDLHGAAWLNPAVVRLLARHGVQVDAHLLAGLANSKTGFTPRRTLDRLRDLTAHLPGLTVGDAIIVSTFLDLAPALLANLDEVSDSLVAHPVVCALAAAGAGQDAATRAWAEAGGAASEPASGRATPFARDWSGEPDPSAVPVTIFALDAEQRAAVRAAARCDVAVLAPPGSGVTQVAAQMVVQAAEAGERVLVVAPRRTELTDLAARLARAGLRCLTDEDSVADSNTAVLTPVPDAAERRALHEVDPAWQVSKLQVLRTLAAAIAEDEAGADAESAVENPRLPRTRLTEPALSRLVGANRARAAELLGEAVTSSALRVGPKTTAWYGTGVTTGDEVLKALETVHRLESSLPRLRALLATMREQTGFIEQATLGGWQRQVELLAAVRATLTVFEPAVYTTAVDDMIVATATAQWRAQHANTMSMRERYRHRKAAKALLRPETDPGDLHEALVRAHEERRRWGRMCPDGTDPSVPAVLADVEHELDHVKDDITHLGTVLAGTPWLGEHPDLRDVLVDDLLGHLVALSAQSTQLRAWPRQRRVRAELDDLGLSEVAASLRDATEVPPSLAADLEVSWCAGVLRAMDAAAAHQQDAPAAPAEDSGDAGIPVRDARVEEITWLRDSAASGEPVTATLATALSVPHRFSVADRFDRVLLLGAHRLGLAEAVLSIVHGRRLAVIGDPAGVRPTGLDLGDEQSADSARPRRSVLEAAGRALPSVNLRPSGQRRLDLELVADGRTAPSWGPDVTETRAAQGHVEAPEAEVRRVVDLVLAHADESQHHSRSESLAVLSLTRPHARRIADMLRVRLRQRPQLADWLIRSGPEAFAITDIARAEDLVRDRLILGVGFGLTPHGALLHRFGPLDTPDGARLLRSAVTRARQRLTVVTCLTAADLDPNRMNTAGAHGLRELLRAAGEGPGRVPAAAGEPDPVLSLLVSALTELGATVTVTVTADPHSRDESFSDAPAIPDLVVEPGGGRTPVAVLWDGRTPAGDPALAVARDAQLSTTLSTLGWPVCTVRAADILIGRRAVAEAILQV
ncbi:MAG: hypothetical protein CSB46_06875 [Micrococcales bacterium]|nr:MAG: hypothetical protein CSB46_06875 [Micrococcales bacterium]